MIPFFKSNKISYEEFDKKYRPILIEIARDCISKAKLMYKNPLYKKIEDIKYVAANSNLEEDQVQAGQLHTYIFEDNYIDIIINVIDGQDGVCTSAGAKFLDEIEAYLKNKFKSKLSEDGKEIITIETGDGDEGCVYVEFNYKLLAFYVRDIKYKPIKETVLERVLSNVKIL